MQNLDAIRRGFNSALSSLGQNVPTAAQVGLRGDGSDEGAALNAALATYGVIKLPAGFFVSSSVKIQIPDNGALLGSGRNSGVTALASLGVNNGVVALGNQSTVADLAINCNGFCTAGVSGANVSGWLVRDVLAQNATNNTDAGSSQGFNFTGCSDGRIVRPTAFRCLHGVQLWQCDRIIVEAALVDRVREGGIFTADCTNIQVIGGILTNGGDVGLDFEGGSDCYGIGVFVAGFKNGEFTLFKNAVTPANGCHRLQFIDCVGHRVATYTATDGSSQACDSTIGNFDVSSLSDNATGVGFFGGTQTVDFGLAYANHTNSTSQEDVTWAPDLVTLNTNGPICRTYIFGRGNTIAPKLVNCTQQITQQTHILNWNGAKIGPMEIKNTSSAANAVIVLAVESNNAGELTGNMDGVVFTGFDAGVGTFKFDAFGTGNFKFTIGAGCRFSDGPVANGGVTVTTNGQPVWNRTPINISLGKTTSPTWSFDVATLPWIANASSAGSQPVFAGELLIQDQNLYLVNYVKARVSGLYGTGASSGVGQNAAYYVSGYSGSVISGAASSTAVNLVLRGILTMPEPLP